MTAGMLRLICTWTLWWGIYAITRGILDAVTVNEDDDD